MKKYEFTGKSMEFEGMTLRRIRRLSDGVVGGWIQSEDNLSHEGGCFVYHNAKVYHFAKVFDNAMPGFIKMPKYTVMPRS
jgi:hypothetical protein